MSYQKTPPSYLLILNVTPLMPLGFEPATFVVWCEITRQGTIHTELHVSVKEREESSQFGGRG